MAKEIERKFLIANDHWKDLPAEKQQHVIQGYIICQDHRSLRVRICNNKNAFLTIKGETFATSRSEFEYTIPLDDAKKMLEEFCEKDKIIEKTRYNIAQNNLIWEVDVFAGANKGLVVVEVELNSEKQKIKKPQWVGKEVSNDPRYFNVNLVQKPFTKW